MPSRPTRLHRPSTSPDETPPSSFVDRQGRTIQLHQYGRGPLGDEFEALFEFYLEFDPEQRSSGVPPIGELAIRRWLDRILSGYCIVAWHDDRAVGQVVLVTDPPEGQRHELALFVDREYQRCGIGSELVRSIVEIAAEEGIERVYRLTENPWMAALARTHGFKTTDRVAGQTTLVLNLQNTVDERYIP